IAHFLSARAAANQPTGIEGLRASAATPAKNTLRAWHCALARGYGHACPLRLIQSLLLFLVHCALFLQPLFNLFTLLLVLLVQFLAICITRWRWRSSAHCHAAALRR